MKKLAFIVVFMLLLAGCNTTSGQTDNYANNAGNAPNQSSNTSNNSGSAVNQPEQVVENQTEVETTPTSGPDCFGPEVHPVGQSIADQFNELTDYNQVMVWFCNGTQFDDILTALLTEESTAISAADLLDMLHGGLTWDEIWVEIGLTEE
jgi:hypothetical protein